MKVLFRIDDIHFFFYAGTGLHCKTDFVMSV